MKFKKSICVFACVLVFTLLPMSVFASTVDETNPKNNAFITAEVPSVHKLNVDVNGAKVFVDGQIITGESVMLKRQSTPKLLIRAESGRKVETVMLDDKDITAEIKNGQYELDKIITEHKLTVTTSAETVLNKQIFTVTGTVRQNGVPVSDITLELRSNLKTTVTGNDGTFRFDNVESGHHSLTALRDGKVVGYTEFDMICGADDFGFTIAEDGTVNINLPYNVMSVNINYEITDNGVLSIDDVKSEKSNGNSPQTGDNSRVVFWIILMVISLCTVFKRIIQKEKCK